jgi:hypothetical protein
VKRSIGRIKGDGGPLSGTVYDFDDFEEAARFSMSRKAVSKDMYEVWVPPFNNAPGMKLRAQLCYEIAGGKMSWRFHSSPGIPIDRLPRPTSKDIDRVRAWRAW